jgi:DNA polymerase-3 subunit gamma/tau
MEQFVVSARKYRPVTFESVVGQDTIATTLKNAIRRNQLAHAYLFCGPRGVGKTTCARIFAKTINCLQPSEQLEACGQCESCLSFAEGRSYSIHELDAASNNSVDDIRLLSEQVRVPPQIGKYSVYIIDEVHMLSPAAFNAFLKTLEEPPAHAVFILATTEKHKIIPTILSRCQIYDFNRISIDGMVNYLTNIAQREGISVEPAALNIIAQKADGAMRDALSLFDQAVVFCGNAISYDAIIKNLHVVDYKYYFTLTDSLLEHRYTDALLLFDEILAKGFDALHFVAGLSDHFRNLLVCKDPVTLQLFESGEAFRQNYLEQTTRCSVDFLLEALRTTNACEVGYKSSSHPRLHVELALLRLAHIGLERPTTAAPVAPPKEAPGAPQAAAAPSAPSLTILQSVSIKEELSKTGKSKSAAQPPAPETTQRQTPFDQGQMEAAWKNYIAGISDERQIAYLSTIRPALDEAHRVAFEVKDLAVKKRFEEVIAPKLVAFLKNELQNDGIELAITIAPQVPAENPTTPPIYTDTQKFNYLKEQHPPLQTLSSALGLDTK